MAGHKKDVIRPGPSEPVSDTLPLYNRAQLSGLKYHVTNILLKLDSMDRKLKPVHLQLMRRCLLKTAPETETYTSYTPIN